MLKVAEDRRAIFAKHLTKVATDIGSKDVQPLGMFLYVQWSDGTHTRIRRHDDGMCYAALVGILEVEKADCVREMQHEVKVV